MPPAPPAKELYETVEAMDVGKAENKLKELEDKRFEAIKDEIIKYFQSYWEQYCTKTEKKNKEL